MKDTILIIDFGSQVTKLIARRIREFGVFSQIIPYHLLKEKDLQVNQVKGINRVTYDISSKPPATIEWE